MKRIGWVLIAIVVGTAVVGLGIRWGASAPARAEVSGRMWVNGGPPPGVHATTDGSIVANDAAGRTWRTRTNDGSFTFSLPPGTYTLTGGPHAINNGAMLCNDYSPVVVRAGHRVTNADVICDIP